MLGGIHQSDRASYPLDVNIEEGGCGLVRSIYSFQSCLTIIGGMSRLSDLTFKLALDYFLYLLKNECSTWWGHCRAS